MNLIPQKNTVQDAVSSLVNQISEDPFYSKIIKSVAFQRLKHISFLGAINYTFPCYNQKSIDKSRFGHSLLVAGLAKHISNERKYDREIEKHIVAAALLHDIGHGPLSHSIEPVFKEKWGVGHHQIGRELILGKQDLGKKLSKILRQDLNVEFVLSLIDGKSSEDFVDMFNSPINIDTIDGITRSYKYLMKGNKNHYDLLEIAEASFVKTKEDREKILDDFWKLKDTIYKVLIRSHSGYKADAVCQIYFKDNMDHFERCDWFSTEKTWKKKYAFLFETLGSSEKLKCFNLFGKNKNLKITRRDYNIDTAIKLKDNSSMKKRYICRKRETNYTPPAFHNIASEQCLLC
jgi:hypothetical protein